MPPKKRTRAGQPFNSSIFVSHAAAERYREYNQKRQAIPGRGLHIPGPIQEEVEKRHWEKLCAQPGPAILPLVMEFYANAKEAGVTDTVFVRGKQVCFSSLAINNFYGLTAPDPSHEFQDFLDNHVDWNDVISDLCKEETNWKHCTSGEVSVFPTKQLAAFPRAWFYFISSTLMPASHLSSVHRNRAALLFAIFNNISINVGTIISEAISFSIQDETLAFVCPNLITGLCKEAGCPWGVNELLIPAKGCFDTKAFHAMKDSQSGFGPRDDYEQPPPPPRRQTMGQKLEQLETMVTEYITTSRANFQEHIRRMEELFDYQRQANETFHQSLVQLSQRLEDSPATVPPLPVFPQKDHTRNDDSA